MKKMLAVLVAALLCVCFGACVAESSDTPTTLPTEQTTEAPTLETVDGSDVDIEHPTLDINVPTPDEMPTLPEGDFHVPPGERPEPPTEVDSM